MKKGRFETVVLAAAGMLLATALHGQSVVDLARTARARTQEGKEGKVFTNENVATSIPAPAAPSAPETPRAAGQPVAPTAPAAGGAATTPAQPTEPSQADLEKEYRGKFAKLREEMSFEEQKLDVMQRELNLMQTQFYANPQDTLTQEYTRSNINQRMQEIEQQKGKVEKAKQAVADLEEELRRKGLPAGWAR